MDTPYLSLDCSAPALSLDISGLMLASAEALFLAPYDFFFEPVAGANRLQDENGNNLTDENGDTLTW